MKKMKWIEIDISEGIVRVYDLTEGDLNSAGIRVVNFPENWKDKLVNAVFYRGTDSIDVILELNADKDRLTGNVPAQMLAEDGSFKIVVYAVANNQVKEPYRDVRPAVWAEVRDGLESAEVLPLDKDVGAYLTLLIDLQNKGASIDEMIARLGDIEAIKTKLDGVADGAEVNVQADWAETDPLSDAFIPNKPNLKEMEDRLREEINLTNDVAINAESSADANKEALELHRANEDVNAQHLTAAEKESLQSRLTDIDSIIEEIEQIDGDIDNVKGEILQESERLNRLTDEMYGLKDRVLVLEAIPKTEVPTTLEVNTAYNFGSQNTALTLTFPSIANDGDVIYIGFVCREGLNLVVDTTNTFDFDLIPEKDTGYEIYAKCTTNLGVLKWIVKYSEYSGV